MSITGGGGGKTHDSLYDVANPHFNRRVNQRCGNISCKKERQEVSKNKHEKKNRGHDAHLDILLEYELRAAHILVLTSQYFENG
jgi:hypothetical protein